MNLVSSVMAGLFLLAENAHGAPAATATSKAELYGKNAGFTTHVVRRCAATPAERERVKHSGSELIDVLTYMFKDAAAVKRGYVDGTFIAIKRYPPPARPSPKECAEARQDEQKTLNWFED